MTREEEILNAYQELKNSLGSQEHSFMMGAKWADRTLLDKACEWIERNYHATPNGGYYYLPEDCIEQFRKAMEQKK